MLLKNQFFKVMLHHDDAGKVKGVIFVLVETYGASFLTYSTFVSKKKLAASSDQAKSIQGLIEHMQEEMPSHRYGGDQDTSGGLSEILSTFAKDAGLTEITDQIPQSLLELLGAVLSDAAGPHKHRCGDCNVTWEHDTIELIKNENREGYVKAHECPKCGKEVYSRYIPAEIGLPAGVQIH